MRTLSRRCKYALRAAYRLAREFERGPLPISHIAEQERIPRKFLEAILLEMRRRGIVESREGMRGGYFLSRLPNTITVGEIVRAVDGPLAPISCVSESAYRPCAECPDISRCETRAVMRDVRDAIAGILDRTTLSDACDRYAASHDLTFEI